MPSRVSELKPGIEGESQLPCLSEFLMHQITLLVSGTVLLEIFFFLLSFV